MKKIEVILWGLLLTTTILRTLFNIPFPIALCIGGSLSILYFFCTIFLLNNIPLKAAFNKAAYNNISNSRMIGSILTGLTFAILSISITFKILAWPGSRFLLFLSLILTTIILIITSTRLKKSEEQSFYCSLKKRCIVLIIIAISFLILSFFPKETQQKIFPLTNEYPVNKKD